MNGMLCKGRRTGISVGMNGGRWAGGKDGKRVLVDKLCIEYKVSRHHGTSPKSAEHGIAYHTHIRGRRIPFHLDWEGQNESVWLFGLWGEMLRLLLRM